MSEVLRDLVGRRVKVWTLYSSGEHTDEGTLDKADDAWLRIRKNSGELFCFSAANVRLVKVVG